MKKIKKNKNRKTNGRQISYAEAERRDYIASVEIYKGDNDYILSFEYYHKRPRMIKWCKENIDEVFAVECNNWLFQCEGDAMAFKLMWG